MLVILHKNSLVHQHTILMIYWHVILVGLVILCHNLLVDCPNIVLSLWIQTSCS